SRTRQRRGPYAPSPVCKGHTPVGGESSHRIVRFCAIITGPGRRIKGLAPISAGFFLQKNRREGARLRDGWQYQFSDGEAGAWQETRRHRRRRATAARSVGRDAGTLNQRVGRWKMGAELAYDLTGTWDLNFNVNKLDLPLDHHMTLNFVRDGAVVTEGPNAFRARFVSRVAGPQGQEVM